MEKQKTRRVGRPSENVPREQVKLTLHEPFINRIEAWAAIHSPGVTRQHAIAALCELALESSVLRDLELVRERLADPATSDAARRQLQAAEFSLGRHIEERIKPKLSYKRKDRA